MDIESLKYEGKTLVERHFARKVETLQTQKDELQKALKLLCDEIDFQNDGATTLEEFAVNVCKAKDKARSVCKNLGII